MKGLLLSGDIRVAYVDADGVPTGRYIGILNTPKMSINVPDPETIIRTSQQNDSFGQALDTIIKAKPTEFEITFDDLGEQEVLGWALNGTTSPFTQASATVVDEAVVASPGKWTKLANRAVSSVVVKHTSGAPTYVLGTDYLVAGPAGFIKVIGSTITEAQSLKVSYSAAALTGTKVSVGTRSALSLRIEGDMRNLVDGGVYHVVAPLARVSPTGGLDLKGSTFLVSALKGNLLSISGAPVADIVAIDPDE